MNARTDESVLLPVRLTSPYANTITVSPWDFPMVCSYEFDPGESPVVTGGPDNWHPGTPPNVELLSCTVGGVDITEMVRPEQQERIEEAILSALGE